MILGSGWGVEDECVEFVARYLRSARHMEQLGGGYGVWAVWRCGTNEESTPISIWRLRGCSQSPDVRVRLSEISQGWSGRAR